VGTVSVLPFSRKLALKGIPLFGLMEIAIGVITLLSIPFFARLGHVKPLGELFFVLTRSLFSFVLGAGILFRFNPARRLLVFFSGWVIITKVLIYLGVMTLVSEVSTTISIQAKNIISLLYHALLILYLRHPLIKKEFNRQSR